MYFTSSSLHHRMEKQVKRCRSRVSERTKIVWMWLQGVAARDIARLTGVSLTTVYRWVRRWEDQGTVQCHPVWRASTAIPWQVVAVMVAEQYSVYPFQATDSTPYVQRC